MGPGRLSVLAILMGGFTAREPSSHKAAVYPQWAGPFPSPPPILLSSGQGLRAGVELSYWAWSHPITSPESLHMLFREVLRLPPPLMCQMCFQLPRWTLQGHKNIWVFGTLMRYLWTDHERLESNSSPEVLDFSLPYCHSWGLPHSEGTFH